MIFFEPQPLGGAELAKWAREESMCTCSRCDSKNGSLRRWHGTTVTMCDSCDDDEYTNNV